MGIALMGAATLLAACGVASDPDFPPDGINLLPMLTQRAAPVERKLFWRYKANAQRAARDGDFKYLKILENTFLFNVAEDPMERANLKVRHKDVYDRIAAEWNLNLVNLKAADPAPGLWQTDTSACCARHKVGPLFSSLEAYDVWFTALRRDQSASRANLKEVEPFKLPSGNVIRKVAPLAAWTARDVWRYAKDHAIKLLPLYDLGYTSIGCEPCTSLPLDPSNDRSGRWGGQKLECGIHLEKQ
jgi:phosphoadenylyl-sulfate reductase (thioredoxin)